MKERVQEAIALAMITTGIGMGLFLLPGDLNLSMMLLGLSVLFVVVTAIIKLLPTTQALKNAAFPLVRTPLSPQREGKVSVQTNELQGYFAWVEQQLARLIELEELRCGLAGIKRGPLVITLRLRLINPSHKDLQKLMKLGPALAQILQVEAVRMADTAQGILIEVPSPKPLTPNGALLARHTRGFGVAVGVDTFARPVTVNLKDHGAVFWVGPSRRGKTQSMKSSLYALIQASRGQVQFVICASPAKVQQDWGVFAGLAGCLGVVSSKGEIAAATAWLVEYMNSGQARPTILIIDDLPSLLKAVPTIGEDLIDIASMGAGLGLHFWAGTQGAGSKRTSGGTQIENNVTARIIYKPSTSRTGSQSAGSGGLELHQLSSAKGDALALIDGVATRIATAWISDRDIALLPLGENHESPWKNQVNQSENRPTPPLEPGRTTFEPGENQLEPHRTRLNQVKPPLTHSVNIDTSRPDEQIEQHAQELVSKPVLEPGVEPPEEISGIDQYVNYLSTLTNDQLKSENLGFDGSKFPGADEQRIIMYAYSVSGSLNKACFICYGYKNPKIVSFVKPVIQGAVGDMDEETDSEESRVPDSIDLNTREGRELLKHLQQTGAIKWSDIDELLRKDE